MQKKINKRIEKLVKESCNSSYCSRCGSGAHDDDWKCDTCSE